MMNLVSYFTLIFFTQTSLKISNRIGAWQYSPQPTRFWEAYVFIRFYSRINKKHTRTQACLIPIGELGQALTTPLILPVSQTGQI
jgi:hypothetical protein